MWGTVSNIKTITVFVVANNNNKFMFSLLVATYIYINLTFYACIFTIP